MGVKPSIALLRHFFYLRIHDQAHRSRCVSFIAVHSGNTLMRVRKKVEDFRRKWIYMDARGLHARLELPTEMPEKMDQWAHENSPTPLRRRS